MVLGILQASLHLVTTFQWCIINFYANTFIIVHFSLLGCIVFSFSPLILLVLDLELRTFYVFYVLYAWILFLLSFFFCNYYASFLLFLFILFWSPQLDDLTSVLSTFSFWFLTISDTEKFLDLFITCKKMIIEEKRRKIFFSYSFFVVYPSIKCFHTENSSATHCIGDNWVCCFCYFGW